MRIDIATLAFGYTLKSGGGTPNWATSLGQGKDYKINEDAEIDNLLKGLVYSSVSLSKIVSKIGKGGRMVSGDADDSPIIVASVFEKVYINDKLINGGKYIIIVTRDTSPSHAGRLRFKYGPSNTYRNYDLEYSNNDFWGQARKQLCLADEACMFVYDISVRNQNELILRTIVVDPNGAVDYENSTELHEVWEGLIKADEKGASLTASVKKRRTGAENILLYGVPGSGKSHEIDTKYCDDEEYIERVVFHPDYMYSDFVGQILPRVEKDTAGNEKLRYIFNPGPFTKVLKKAVDDPAHFYYLIIEELNRGNAPAIFGEIFQLLDRKDEDKYPHDEVGESIYFISNYDVAREVYQDEAHHVRIPSNMYILATMNTADQNVFTLDTAFQRRWNMRQIKNRVEESEHASALIAGTNVNWGAFATVINDMVIEINVDMASSEDKRLGAYFVKEKELEVDSFPEKVLKYLWDDAFKMDKTAIFNDGCKTLEDVVTTYKNTTDDKLKSVLRSSVYEKMLSKMQKKTTGDDTES